MQLHQDPSCTPFCPLSRVKRFRVLCLRVSQGHILFLGTIFLKSFELFVQLLCYIIMHHYHVNCPRQSCGCGVASSNHKVQDNVSQTFFINIVLRIGYVSVLGEGHWNYDGSQLSQVVDEPVMHLVVVD